MPHVKQSYRLWSGCGQRMPERGISAEHASATCPYALPPGLIVDAPKVSGRGEDGREANGLHTLSLLMKSTIKKLLKCSPLSRNLVRADRKKVRTRLLVWVNADTAPQNKALDFILTPRHKSSDANNIGWINLV